MRCLLALFLSLFTTIAFAQGANESAVTDFLEQYNGQRAARDWATTERTDVRFRIDSNNTLIALLGEGETRIDLDRDANDPMDAMFPLLIEQATIISTNATILFIDPKGEYHFAFTLLDEPAAPALTQGYFTYFTGFGIGRRSAVH